MEIIRPVLALWTWGINSGVSGGMAMRVTLCPLRLGRVLLYAVIGLSLLSFCLGIVRELTGHGRLMGFGTMFNVAAESNVPTWFSSSMLLLCSILLGVIAAWKRSAGDRYTRHWQILALALLFLSADESCSIHETVGGLMERLPSGGLMQLSWVLPAAVGVCVFGLMYARFMFHLPSSTRRRFLLAALMFGAGSLGLEAVGGQWRMAHGDGGIPFLLMETTEEFLEMAGVVTLVYALMSYMTVHMEVADIRIGEEAQPSQAVGTIPTDLSEAA